MQLHEKNSPFTQEQVELLNRLLPTLTESQRIWLSGFFSAQNQTASSEAAAATATAVPPVPELAGSPAQISQPAVSNEVTVLFGSQTGNCQGLADDFSRKLEEQGFQVTLSSMGDFKPKGLKKIENLFIIVSTHGEGDPPDNALSFHEFLYSKRAPKLENLRYSVLALGDSSYEFFCKTGKDFDEKLEELGGERLVPRTDCDVDFDEPAAEWFENVLNALNELQQGAAAASVASNLKAVPNDTVQQQTEQTAYSRTNPFQAEILENLNLNGRGSNQETRHLELSLEGSNLSYKPGDCLGIYPENHPELVDTLIDTMGWNRDEPVAINQKGEERPLREALLKNFEITVLTKPLLEKAARFSSNEGLSELLDPEREQELRDYLQGRDLLDVVQDFAPWQGSASDFVSILRKMPARLYSIASSLKANPDEVHLLIRTVRYNAHGRERYGVCSVHCSDRVELGDTLPVYIQNNPNFNLPSDPDVPIIMIGPGTGVAPFRAFMEEREEIGAEGKTWLFFGDQHFCTDFLYQVEWQKWLEEGVLTRMDVAFSRDTDKKVYVQHRMLEKSKELFQWLSEGAHVYVCGDEKRMAKDVHATLVTILEQEGGMGPEEAAAFLDDMQQQKRYQRDVY